MLEASPAHASTPQDQLGALGVRRVHRPAATAPASVRSPGTGAREGRGAGSGRVSGRISGSMGAPKAYRQVNLQRFRWTGLTGVSLRSAATPRP